MTRILIISSFSDIYCSQGDDYFDFTIEGCIGSSNTQNINLSKKSRHEHRKLKILCFELILDLLRSLSKTPQIEILYRPHPYEDTALTTPLLCKAYPSLLLDDLSQSYVFSCETFKPEIIITSMSTCLYQLLFANFPALLVEVAPIEISQQQLSMLSAYLDYADYSLTDPHSLLDIQASHQNVNGAELRSLSRTKLFHLFPPVPMGAVLSEVFPAKSKTSFPFTSLQFLKNLRLFLAAVILPFLAILQITYFAFAMRQADARFSFLTSFRLQLSKASLLRRSRLLYW